MTIPYTFAGATTAIPLAQLDANFASPITLGNVAMTLSNTYTSIGNLTLTNVTISSTSTPITVPQGGTGLTSLTAGYIPFGNGTGAFGNSANLFWDSTNSRLGIGTASPAYPLDVVGNAKASSNVFCGDAFAFVFGTGTTSYLTGSSSTNYISAVTNSAERMRIDSSGNVFVGGTTPAGSNKPVYAQTTAKAWLNFSDNGTTCTINASFNVGSITRYSTGNYGINFSNSVNSSRSSAIAQASYTDSVNATAFVNGVNTGTNGCQVISVLQANWCSVVVFS